MNDVITHLILTTTESASASVETALMIRNVAKAVPLSYGTLLVILETPMRDDDAGALVKVFGSIVGVMDVDRCYGGVGAYSTAGVDLALKVLDLVKKSEPKHNHEANVFQFVSDWQDWKRTETILIEAVGQTINHG